MPLLDGSTTLVTVAGGSRPAPESQQSYHHVAALRLHLAAVVALAERMLHQVRDEPAQLALDGENHVVVGKAKQTRHARALQTYQHGRNDLVVALQLAALVRTERQQDVLQAKQRNLKEKKRLEMEHINKSYYTAG